MFVNTYIDREFLVYYFLSGCNSETSKIAITLVCYWLVYSESSTLIGGELPQGEATGDLQPGEASEAGNR